MKKERKKLKQLVKLYLNGGMYLQKTIKQKLHGQLG